MFGRFRAGNRTAKRRVLRALSLFLSSALKEASCIKRDRRPFYEVRSERPPATATGLTLRTGVPAATGAPVRRSGPGRPEAVTAAGRLFEHIHLVEIGDRVAHEHQLGDAVAELDVERLRRVGVQQQDADLASIAGVDEPGCVRERYPVTRSKAAARQDQPCPAPRYLECDPSPDG